MCSNIYRRDFHPINTKTWTFFLTILTQKLRNDEVPWDVPWEKNWFSFFCVKAAILKIRWNMNFFIGSTIFFSPLSSAWNSFKHRQFELNYWADLALSGDNFSDQERWIRQEFTPAATHSNFTQVVLVFLAQKKLKEQLFPANWRGSGYSCKKN